MRVFGRCWGFVLCAAVSLWCNSAPLYCQYYDTKEYPRTEDRYLSVGVLRSEFSPRPNNSLPDSVVSRFATLMPMIAFHQGPVDIYLGYTRYEQRGGFHTAVVFGTQITRDFPLGGGRTGGLVLPLMIAADYTKVASSGPQRDDFNLATLGIGAGLKYRLVTPNAEFSIQGVQLFHAAFQGIAAGTGSSLATVGEAGLFLPRIPIGDGIVLRYRVRLQTWSLNDDRFNYRLLYHGPSIGIVF